MYRRPKFLEKLIRIRRSMAREANYDVDRFTEMVRGRRAFMVPENVEEPVADNIPTQLRPETERKP